MTPSKETALKTWDWSTMAISEVPDNLLRHSRSIFAVDLRSTPPSYFYRTHALKKKSQSTPPIMHTSRLIMILLCQAILTCAGRFGDDPPDTGPAMNSAENLASEGNGPVELRVATVSAAQGM